MLHPGPVTSAGVHPIGHRHSNSLEQNLPPAQARGSQALQSHTPDTVGTSHPRHEQQQPRSASRCNKPTDQTWQPRASETASLHHQIRRPGASSASIDYRHAGSETLIAPQNVPQHAPCLAQQHQPRPPHPHCHVEPLNPLSTSHAFLPAHQPHTDSSPGQTDQLAALLKPTLSAASMAAAPAEAPMAASAGPNHSQMLLDSILAGSLLSSSTHSLASMPVPGDSKVLPQDNAAVDSPMSLPSLVHCGGNNLSQSASASHTFQRAQGSSSLSTRPNTVQHTPGDHSNPADTVPVWDKTAKEEAKNLGSMPAAGHQHSSGFPPCGHTPMAPHTRRRAETARQTAEAGQVIADRKHALLQLMLHQWGLPKKVVQVGQNCVGQGKVGVSETC